MESDKDKLIRLGIKAALNPGDLGRFEAFVDQKTRCQNDSTCDRTVSEDVWYLAQALQNSIVEVRTANKMLMDNLRRLERA